jgi:hypothetical protein
MSAPQPFATAPTPSVNLAYSTQSSGEAEFLGGVPPVQVISRARVKKTTPTTEVTQLASPAEGSEGAPSDSGADLRQSEPEALINALGNVESRPYAEAEINRRLPQNEVNRQFFWLVYGMRHDISDIRGAYENLQRLARNYLSGRHAPSIKIQKKRKGAIRPDWDDIIQHTLFGSETVTGEVEKFLPLPASDHLKNALQNRYSGVLTRMGQRHKDYLRRARFEQADLAGERTTVSEYGDRSESIVGLEKHGHAIFDTVGYAENIADCRFGLPGLGGTGDETEHIFQQPFAVVEWTKKHQEIIECEAGALARRTWKIITEANADNVLDFCGMTIAGARKALVALIGCREKISKKAAAKRLARLRASGTLRKYLSDESRFADRHAAPPPRLVKVGKSHRKKIGTEQFIPPDRSCAPRHSGAE